MTKVSRSIYQKLKEENKRLLADIKVMACGECFEAIQMRIKWRTKFKRVEAFNAAMKAVALRYFKQHPELNYKNN